MLENKAIENIKLLLESIEEQNKILKTLVVFAKDHKRRLALIEVNLGSKPDLTTDEKAHVDYWHNREGLRDLGKGAL